MRIICGGKRVYVNLKRIFAFVLQRLTQANFLAEVQPGQPDAAALLTIARHPAYSQFDRLARRILQPRVAFGGDSNRRLGLRATYDLYEYWCFFTVVEAAQRALPEAVWKPAIEIEPGELLLQLKNGSALHGSYGEKSFSVVFQQKYDFRSPDADGLFSISKNCIPDIVLTIRQAGRTQTIVFDAKYRAGKDSIHAALSDIHVYRDAIRTAADRSGVEAAFILTPAHAAQVHRYYEHAYRREFRFGGLDLSPRNARQKEALADVLREWLLDHRG